MQVWILVMALEEEGESRDIRWPASLPVPVTGDRITLDDGDVVEVTVRTIRLTDDPPQVAIIAKRIT